MKVLKASVLAFCGAMAFTVAAMAEPPEPETDGFEFGPLGFRSKSPPYQKGKWHTCTIERTGINNAVYYAFLRCNGGIPATYYRFFVKERDAMLATALTAFAIEKSVVAFIHQPIKGQIRYGAISAMYVAK